MNFQSLIERKLIPQGKSGNDIIYACPKCEDLETGHHMYVNYDKNKYHCFKCGAGGRRLESLLQLLNISIDYDYDKLYTEQDKSLDDILSMKRVTKEEELLEYSTDLEVMKEYYEIHTMKNYLSAPAYEYLKSRGLTDEMMINLKLTEGLNRFGEKFYIKGKEYVGRDYSGRIMIPSLRKDDLISFYLGRDYTGTKSNKYSNAPKDIGIASEDVWSLDIIEGDTVIICEGAFTAIAVNNALSKIVACATYGKSIAQKSSETNINVTSQGEKLLNKKFKTYIIFYDKDALKEAYQNAHYLYERGAFVRVVKIPKDMYGDHADAADMTREEIISLIVNSEIYDPFLSNISSLM